MGFQIDNQSHVPSNTIPSYFSLLRAYHVNHKMLLQLFERLWLSFFIKDGKQSFPHTKAVCLHITTEILLKITRHQPTDGNKLKIDAEFKVA